MELHNAIRKRSQKYTVTRALHNYDSMMFTEDAIYALEREHNRLVAKISALEVIDDVLGWWVYVFINETVDMFSHIEYRISIDIFLYKDG